MNPIFNIGVHPKLFEKNEFGGLKQVYVMGKVVFLQNYNFQTFEIKQNNTLMFQVFTSDLNTRGEILSYTLVPCKVFV